MQRYKTIANDRYAILLMDYSHHINIYHIYRKSDNTSAFPLVYCLYPLNYIIYKGLQKQQQNHPAGFDYKSSTQLKNQ